VTFDAVAAATALASEAGLDGLRPILGGVELRPVGVGWATVDLARTTRELLGPRDRGAAHDLSIDDELPVDELPVDELLGARARTFALAGMTVVLLEPTTEGRLAAALARRDEGAAVLYLAPLDGELGATLDVLAAAGIRTRRGHGPFGQAALVLGRPAAGPQLILVAVPSGP
jgi:hypothetical protein